MLYDLLNDYEYWSILTSLEIGRNNSFSNQEKRTKQKTKKEYSNKNNLLKNSYKNTKYREKKNYLIV